jgi:arabinofuranosyltransferase
MNMTLDPVIPTLDPVKPPRRFRSALDAAAVAVGTLGGVVAVRLLLLGEIRDGFLLGGADLALLAVRLRSRTRPAPQAIACGLAGAFLVWCTAFIALASTIGPDGRRYFCLFDDAMISMRYAWNLAHGQGLVWNPGERVEGYTNPLMTLLMAVPALGLDRSAAVLAVQFLGVAVMLAVAALASVVAGRLAEAAQASAARLSIWAAVLACYPLAYWTILGMETGMLSLLLLAATLLALRLESGGRPRFGLPALLGLAVLTRPDAMLPALVLLAYRLRESRAARVGIRRWLAEASVFVAFPGGLTLFRWLYYGSLVPNTYVLKIEGLPLAHRLQTGLSSLGSYLLFLLPVIILAGFGLRRADRREVLLAALWCSSLAAHVWVGGDAWPRWRFLCPTLPILLVLAARGVLDVAAAWPRWSRPLALAGLATVVACTNAPFLREAVLASYPFGIPDDHAHVRVAVDLRRLCTPEASVGVFFAGTVPYYSGLRAIDFLGKSDPHVARRPPDLHLAVGHNKTDLRYSIGERRPDYVEHFIWGADNASFAEPRYVRVGDLWLLRNSPHVRWEMVPDR